MLSASLLAQIKVAHALLACVSGLGFLARGISGWLGYREILGQRWVRVVPHIVDSALLAAGLTLAVSFSISPLQQPWFATKLVLLAGYIGTGGRALRLARRGRPAGIWFALALLCLGGVFLSALTRRPLGLP